MQHRPATGCPIVTSLKIARVYQRPDWTGQTAVAHWTLHLLYYMDEDTEPARTSTHPSINTGTLVETKTKIGKVIGNLEIVTLDGIFFVADTLAMSRLVGNNIIRVLNFSILASLRQWCEEIKCRTRYKNNFIYNIYWYIAFKHCKQRKGESVQSSRYVAIFCFCSA